MNIQAACVTAVEARVALGAYAPHTLVGSIVVDGVVAHSVADLEIGDKFMSDVFGSPLEWYHSKCTAYLRVLDRMGLLPKNGNLLQHVPVALISLTAQVKSLCA